MTLTVDLFSTSAGFISSTMTQAALQVTQEGQEAAGLEPVPPCGLSSKAQSAPEVPVGCRGSHDIRNRGQIPTSALLSQTTRGQLETPQTGTHTDTLTVDVPLLSIALAQLLHRNCKDSPAHTALQGPGAASPSVPQGNSAHSQVSDSTHCSGSAGPQLTGLTLTI